MSASDDIDWYDGEEENEDEIIPFIKIIHKSKKAILFQNSNGHFWLPKSIIQVNKKEKFVLIPAWCDWKYFNPDPPKHPNPKGKICLTKSGKPKQIKNTM